MRRSQEKSSAFLLRSLYGKSVNPDQTAPIGAVCSGSTLFATILKLVSNVRQLFAADDFSRCHFSDTFFLHALRVKRSQKRFGSL